MWFQVESILTILTAKNALKVFTIMMVLGMLNILVIFPKIVEYNIQDMIELREDSWMRGIWEKYPMYVEFKMFIWNVTNPEEVVAGGVPILNEIGPYYFE